MELQFYYIYPNKVRVKVTLHFKSNFLSYSRQPKAVFAVKAHVWQFKRVLYTVELRKSITLGGLFYIC